MAKIKKRNLDSAKRAPVRKQSYEAPAISRRKRSVPKEYQSLKKAPKGKGSCLWFLFLLFAATAAGFWHFSKESTEQIDNSIKLIIDGPSKIISGDQTNYKVTYENIDTVTMQKLELSVRWPNGFYFDEANIDPIDQNATTWLLDDLAPGQKVDLEIKGQIVGQKGDELVTAFTLAYQPENFHSDFKVKDSIDTKISDSRIELSVDVIDKALVVSRQEIKINFKNLTEEKLEDLYIDILYPDDFEIIQKLDEIDLDNEDEEGVDIASESEENIIESVFIKEGDYFKLNLEASENQTMFINGVFSIDSKVEQLLVVEVGNMVGDNFRRLSRVEKNITVVNPSFDMDFQINGKQGNQTLNWGDNLKYQLELTNNSESVIEDVIISATLDSQALDWETVDTIGNYSDSKIVWTKNENEDLATWPAGESRIFTWQIDVVSEPLPDRMLENIIEINIDGLEDWNQVSSPLMLTIGESISFNNGVYWDLGGRRVGSGLLPPQANEETEYLVIWSLPEATGSFDSVIVSTNLPPQVDFISEMDIQGGDLDFNLEDRSLIWSIEDFSDLILPLTASFIVRIIPEEDNIGKSMTILNTTNVNATGIEDVAVRSKAIKTSDVVSDSSSPIGIIE